MRMGEPDNENTETGPQAEGGAGLPPVRARGQIEQWFVDYLAQHLQLPPQQIDVNIPFDDFALDSATAISMTGDLEQWLGRRVDPTLVFDYPTIAELADHLAMPTSSADSA